MDKYEIECLRGMGAATRTWRFDIDMKNNLLYRTFAMRFENQKTGLFDCCNCRVEVSSGIGRLVKAI